ncbi:caspase family protein [Novosphingobium lentum]|uniref:caspase family protein n=1 Tax=Novosphingobium lentum TaxID=145287 RepID=UPI000A803E12|nr:hypothetical protein [Novosphingobium lentum]
MRGWRTAGAGALQAGVLLAMPVSAAAAPPRPIVAPPVGGSYGVDAVRVRPVPQSTTLTGEVSGWSNDDAFVAAADSDQRRLVIWDVTSGHLVNQIALPRPTESLAVGYERLTFLPDGLHIRIEGTAGLAERRFAIMVDIAKSRATMEDAAPAALPAGAQATDLSTPRAHHSARWFANDPGERAGGPAAPYITDRPPSAAPGKVLVRLTSKPRTGLLSSALSPDGHTFAMIGDVRPAPDPARPDRATVRIVFFDLLAERFAGSATIASANAQNYNRVAWIDAGHVLLSRDSLTLTRASMNTADDAADDNLPPELVIDVATGKLAAPPLAPHCSVVPLGNMVFVGATPADCGSGADKPGGLERFDPASGWRPFATAVPKDGVARIVVSPDAMRIGVVTGLGHLHQTVLVLDAASGAILASHPFPAIALAADVAFADRADRLVIAVGGKLFRWEPAKGPPVPMTGAGAAGTAAPEVGEGEGLFDAIAGAFAIAAVGDTLYQFDGTSATHRFSLATGAPQPDLRTGLINGLGRLGSTGLVWTTDGQEIKTWSPQSGEIVLRTFLFDGDHFLATTQEGRYDTDLGPDTDEFRWLVSDHPLRPLPAQTFMRLYYEPRLSSRVIACTVAQSCDSAFAPIAGIETINRVLPEIAALTVTQGPAPGIAHVAVTARPVAEAGQSSGLYDLRLFLNGRMVAQGPAGADPASGSIEDWRRINALPLGPDGLAHASFDVPVPLLPPATQRFSAYVFNADRVKSDTVSAPVPVRDIPPRQRHAYVIAVGIDNYDEARFRLNFAVSDARLLAERLGGIRGGYEVDPLVMAGTPATSGGGAGKRVRVTREALGLVFGLLAGKDVDKARVRLAALGFDAAHIAPVGPDDLVIVTWSGHGWTSADAQFYLVPSEGNWPSGAALPDAGTLISADDLTRWLTPINAREIAMVIDACHSAASVEAPGFKPGPMGDRGLGQLAYDKGIRILAASQASDVALEDARLKQGLLTYTLARQGLSDSGGAADLDHDGIITLDEWLEYAVAALPVLSEQVARGQVPGGEVITRSLFITGVKPPPLRPQVPSLFDFNANPSGVVLKVVAP